jgi:hypothetical protein
MRIRHCFSALVGCCWLLALGCSSEGSSTNEEEPQPQEPEEYLGLVAPENGFQLRSRGTSIPAGADVEFCEVAELPGDPGEVYYVTNAEFANGDLSHHLIVTGAVPGSEADQNLRNYEVGDSVPCVSAELTFGESGMVGIGGTQQRYNRIDYPPGVGREYYGGQRVVFDYHYYNTSSEPVDARSAFNLHLTDAEDVQHIANAFGFYNWLIDTPPGEQSSFTGECRFTDDVMVAGLTRHTHRWGTDYSVSFAGGERDGEMFWTSTDFQHDVDYAFESPLLMQTGEGFRFQCNYNNTEAHQLRFGVNATDEMCVLFGLIWDTDARDAPEQDCDIVYADAEGIGRSITETGFPLPSADEVTLCQAGAAAEAAMPSACIDCTCGACANVLIACGLDADCAAILTCVQTGSPAECESVINEHSSAVGMLQQVASCTEAAGCTATCGAM